MSEAALLTAAEPVALLDVRTVARMLNCSARHVHRMSDAGHMPRPVKLGASIRWRRGELAVWIDDGCPSNWRNRQEARP
jgi:predicted DNA-binding transcriptional regulator AlpA